MPNLTEDEKKTLSVLAFLFFRMGMEDRARRFYETIAELSAPGTPDFRFAKAGLAAAAIEAGDAETGVTLMKMELGLDTGPMISVRSTPITKEDTNATLMDRIAHIGADLLVEALEHPYDLTWTPQPEEGVVYAEKLQKSEGRIDWTQSAEVIARRIRAFTPFPSVYFVHGDLNVKVWEAEPVAGEGAPGTVLSVKDGLTIACGEGALRATVLQRPGKPRMPAESFLQSLPIEVNEVLA